MRDYIYNLATDKYKGFIVIPIKAFLFVLSFIYGLAVIILIYCFKSYRLNCKVISVGNITLGGTGKTSLVEFTARYLKQKGRKVAILSRGYKRKVTTHNSQLTTHENMGDEPYMLSKKLGDIPVIVDTDRIKAAKEAIKSYSVDTVILDDGFQQWRIKKDLEVVTVDATNPFGNRYLIPRGILREPLSSLKRADVFILTKTNLNPDVQHIKVFLSKINPAAEFFESIHKAVGFYDINNPSGLLRLDILKAKKATLFSGIGDPDSFENLIVSLGINIGLSFRFPDHHSYTPQDLDKIINESKKKDIDTIVTTEKDEVRLKEPRASSDKIRILVLRIEIGIKDEQRFYSRLLKLYSL